MDSLDSVSQFNLESPPAADKPPRRHSFRAQTSPPQLTVEEARPAAQQRHSYHGHGSPVCTCPVESLSAEEKRRRRHRNANSECGRHGDDWLMPKRVSFHAIKNWFKKKFTGRSDGGVQRRP